MSLSPTLSPNDLPIPEIEDLEEGSSLWKDAWHRLVKNRLAVAGLIIFVGITVFCFLGPILSPYTYEEQDLAYGARSSSGTHWLGTDSLGRDQLTRIMHGGRVSLGVGFLATSVSLLIGVLYGAVSGYKGGKTDAFMMRLVEILYALPFTIFVILLMVVFGRSLVLLFVAIGGR